ncbi:unnamed protein product [Caenorhabditis bovis]|uniref:Major facilitator superfamily (MFS) profile domain-containing protein n=1 Tax=Caenorhabditis bovis TaxID=2654633 RepID=A0A8S1EUZ6_9PELO|nr:unnamed protein product [Caenorhabditis bovis]
MDKDGPKERASSPNENENLLKQHNVDCQNLTASTVKITQTADDFLEQIGIWHPYPLFITFSMASLWLLVVMGAMSPSYTAPSNPCFENCSFITVQNEFNIKKSFIDTGEMAASSFFLGNMIFGQVFAVLADRIGRKPILIGGLLLSGVSGSMAAFAPSFECMLIARFFQGSCYTALSIVNWVMCSECISFAGHGYAAVLFGLNWVIGYCIITPISMYSSSWRHLQFATSIPCIAFAILMIFLLPESFSFLVAKRKRKEVQQWIRTANRYGSDVDYDAQQIIDSYKGEDERTLCDTLKAIWNSQTLVAYTVVESILWVIDLMIYCTLSLSSTGLGSNNHHLSYLLSGIVEVPSYFLIPAAIDWLGRKPSVMMSHLVCAFALLSMYLFDSNEDPQIFLIIWLTAKFSMTCSFLLCFVYGAELFPTNCRTICLGACSTFSNIGAIVAPHVPIMDAFFPGLHYLFYALCSFICTILVTILPETKDKHGGLRSQPQSIA